MRVLVAGGGTGGHLYPGIAVARELLARVPGVQVSFVGTARGIEARVLPLEAFELDVIRSGGLKGKSPVELARGLCLLPLGALDAWRVIGRRRPSIVIGVGGYSSGPVVLAAALRGIPTLLLEQNAAPGLTNRLLARVVDAAAVTYPESAAFFGSRAFVSGNPVRPAFREPRREDAREGQAAREPPRLLVFGGSQGAHPINVAMVEAAGRLAAARPDLSITHQTGERDAELVREGYRRAGLHARVEPFLHAMADEMRAANLAVCRAGATTLAEVAAAGLPAVLVPFPGATDDHQRRNAEALVRGGAAVLVPQGEGLAGRLADDVLALVADEPRRARIGAAVRAFARPDAAARIVDRVLELVAR